MERVKKIDEQIDQINRKLNDPHLCEGTSSTYSRVSGYYRATENWNNGKIQEFQERLEYEFKNS